MLHEFVSHFPIWEGLAGIHCELLLPLLSTWLTFHKCLENDGVQVLRTLLLEVVHCE